MTTLATTLVSRSARRAPRILYAGHFDVPGLMAKSRKHEAPSNHLHAMPDLEAHGFEVIGFDMGPRGNGGWSDGWRAGWQGQQRVLRAAREADLVLTHAHVDARWLAMSRLSGLLRAPLAAFVHTHRSRPWHRALLPGFDCLLPLGARGEDALLANGADPDRVRRFGYGADLQFYAQPLPWPDGEPMVLSVGVSGRDFATLIDAATRIEAPVHIVGRVSDADRARAPANVSFHSNGSYDLDFDALMKLYAKAHCVAVIHHGSEHPFGITALAEAMALGRPAVVTRSAGYDIDVDALVAGRVVPPHDATALADALNAVLADAAAARAMGQRARRACEARWNCAAAAAGLAASLRRVLHS